MLARSIAAAVASVAMIAAPSLARADMPPEPCDGADLGAPCETFDGAEGTCQDVGSYVACVAGGATTAAATTAAVTSAAATTAASTGSGTGGEGTGGSAGGGETDEGCAVRAPSEKSATHLGAAAMFAIASAIAVARRRRRGS